MSPPLKVCACIFWIYIIKISTNCLSASKVNRNSAEKVCAQYGGLLSYQFFLEVKSCQQYRSHDVQISNGESAWVAENVNYSKFVSWQGCYSSVGGIPKETNITTGQKIYMCLQMCKNESETNFIGLDAKICRCMSDRDLRASAVSACGDAANYTVMPGSANLIMNNSNPYGKNIPVYKIHEQGVMALDPPFDMSFGQCVYIEKTTNGSNHFTIKYNTKSCYSKEEMKVYGFVCLSEQPFPNDTCTTFQVDSKFYCVKSSALNWLEANQECHVLNGNLISSVTDITEEMESNLQINIRYWTGIFRDFTIVSKVSMTSGNEVCLSVRNNSNRLVLEPGDCSEQKQVLCNKPFGNDDDPNSFLVPIAIVSFTFNGVLVFVIGSGAVIVYRKSRRRRYRKKIEKRKVEERAKTIYDHIDLKTNTLPKDGTKAEHKNQMQTQK